MFSCFISAANPLRAAQSDSDEAADVFYTIEISTDPETPMLPTLDPLCNNHTGCDHNNSGGYSGSFYTTLPLKQKHLGVSQLQGGPVGQPEAEEGLTTPSVTFSASWPGSPHWRPLESRLVLNASRHALGPLLTLPLVVCWPRSPGMPAPLRALSPPSWGLHTPSPY